MDLQELEQVIRFLCFLPQRDLIEEVSFLYFSLV